VRCHSKSTSEPAQLRTTRLVATFSCSPGVVPGYHTARRGHMTNQTRGTHSHTLEFCTMARKRPISPSYASPSKRKKTSSTEFEGTAQGPRQKTSSIENLFDELFGSSHGEDPSSEDETQKTRKQPISPSYSSPTSKRKNTLSTQFEGPAQRPRQETSSREDLFVELFGSSHDEDPSSEDEFLISKSSRGPTARHLVFDGVVLTQRKPFASPSTSYEALQPQRPPISRGEKDDTCTPHHQPESSEEDHMMDCKPDPSSGDKTLVLQSSKDPTPRRLVFDGVVLTQRKPFTSSSTGYRALRSQKPPISHRETDDTLASNHPPPSSSEDENMLMDWEPDQRPKKGQKNKLPKQSGKEIGRKCEWLGFFHLHSNFKPTESTASDRGRAPQKAHGFLSRTGP